MTRDEWDDLEERIEALDWRPGDPIPADMDVEWVANYLGFEPRHYLRPRRPMVAVQPELAERG